MANSTIIRSFLRLACMIILPLIAATVVSMQLVEAQEKLKLPLGLQRDATFIPDDNLQTLEKIALGKMFFVGLVLAYGRKYLPQAALVIVSDTVMSALFIAYLAAAARRA